MTKRLPLLVALLGALLSAACAPSLREARPDRSLREALGVAAPRTLHRVLGVDLAVHDSDPRGEKPAIVCLHAIAHGGGDFAGVEAALSLPSTGPGRASPATTARPPAPPATPRCWRRSSPTCASARW
jgi:hypothetical protein